MDLKKIEDLETYLLNWINFHQEGGYDFIGAVNLLMAILKNINKNTLESDFEDFEDILDKDELLMLESMFKKFCPRVRYIR